MPLLFKWLHGIHAEGRRTAIASLWCSGTTMPGWWLRVWLRSQRGEHRESAQ